MALSILSAIVNEGRKVKFVLLIRVRHDLSRRLSQVEVEVEVEVEVDVEVEQML